MELAGGKCHVLPAGAHLDLHFVWQQTQSTDDDFLWAGAAGAPGHRADARVQFGHIKGFDDVVVRTGAKLADPIDLSVAGG